jgi:hypothetical protein
MQDDLPLSVDPVEIEDIFRDVQADPLGFHIHLSPAESSRYL